jgi:hypothetical protein
VPALSLWFSQGDRQGELPLVATPSGSIKENAWNFVTVTRSGDGTAPGSIKLYVNGQLAAASQLAYPPLGTDNPAFLGATVFEPGKIDGQLQGRMDNLRIYSRALSPSEISQLHQLETGPRLKLITAVKPVFENLIMGVAYQLQTSSDLRTWVSQGDPFTAADSVMAFPQYFDMDLSTELFFRVEQR